jgi:biotin carboxyl carrier protein
VTPVNKFRMTVASQSYSIEVIDPGGSPLTVVVDGESFQVEVQPLEDIEAPSAALTEAQTSVEAIPQAEISQVRAPMPGTVLDVAVQVGTEIQRDQTLCTLEAMKMKTPLRAQRSGTVQQVAVQDGQTVEHGDLLFVLG